MEQANDTTPKTRAQRKALARARRNDPKTKARRLARLQAKQALAVDRLVNMQANPFDVAWQVGK